MTQLQTKATMVEGECGDWNVMLFRELSAVKQPYGHLQIPYEAKWTVIRYPLSYSYIPEIGEYYTTAGWTKVTDGEGNPIPVTCDQLIEMLTN